MRLQQDAKVDALYGKDGGRNRKEGEESKEEKGDSKAQVGTGQGRHTPSRTRATSESVMVVISAWLGRPMGGTAPHKRASEVSQVSG